MRDRLEDLLASQGTARQDAIAAEHLSSCPECRSEMQEFRKQAEILRSLRTHEVEPAPGFYARVMQRIEEHRLSMWGSFLYSTFAKRLVYASVTVAVMLGTYVITAETRDGHLQAEAVAPLHSNAPIVGSPAEQRDAVLANFAYHEGQLQ